MIGFMAKFEAAFGDCFSDISPALIVISLELLKLFHSLNILKQYTNNNKIKNPKFNGTFLNNCVGFERVFKFVPLLGDGERLCLHGVQSLFFLFFLRRCDMNIIISKYGDLIRWLGAQRRGWKRLQKNLKGEREWRINDHVILHILA
jgi:hypothetical protein